ncbi:hypothetical protein NLU13_8494 [Sarocladium strictum]|uniref:Polynucleotide 5'-hydroxyl-kinase GRC3 n=1 Tax=Sarocladium strictum TaxID=5046 RepID=A0AA39L518_SARSR|nr:hypothetical protein NLU13_8494 [Sarocladium strictum]
MVTGIFGVKVLTGHITVQGANLRPSQVIHWVHASYVHAVPVIRTHQETCLQLLSDKRSDGLRSMGQLSPLYAQLWLRGGDDPSSLQTGRTFDILFSSDDNPKRGLVQELVSPPVWNKKLAGLVPLADKNPGFTVFICGPKSSGKSTMSRLLVNRLLTRGGSQSGESISPNDRAVAVLDIDPGQPEYGPPGTLSLVQVRKPNLASPFSHPGLSDDSYTVFQSHALAAVSPAANPALYRQCAVALYATYRQRMPECPLIVNTPGWIQGTGLELLTDLIKELNPHETLYMSEEGPAESVDALQEASTQEFTTLPSQPSEMTFRTAAELREMQTMSYFHGHQSDLGVSWDHQPLSHSKPCVIPYSGQSSILGILCYDYQAPPSLLSDSINGMVLAMVGIERPAAFGCLLPSPSSRRPQIENTPEGLPYISNPKDVALDPRHSTLLGLVLIRGIDTKKRALLGLSPVLGENKDTINAYAGDIVLIHGNFGCPNWAYTEMLYYSQARGRVVDQKQTTHSDMTATSAVPWVEVLEGNQSRPVGSRRWRVRRDLGRGG